MHAALFLALTLVTAAPDSLTIASAPPATGETYTHEETLTLSMSMSGTIEGVQVMSMSMTQLETARWVETISAWSDTGREAEVKYLVANTKESGVSPEGPVDESTEAPVVGKTYRITRAGEDDPRTFARADGTPISDAERDWLTENYEGLSGASRFAEATGDKPVKVGENLATDPELLKAALDFNELPNGKLEIKEFKLDRIEVVDGNRCGVFLGDLSLSGEQDGMPLTMNMALEVWLRERDGRALDMKMSGPMGVEMSQEVEPGTVMVVKVDGKLDGRMSQTKQASK